MNIGRRIFLRKLALGGGGIILSGTSFANISIIRQKPNKKSGIVNFPFFKYLKSYNFGEYFPKDQGGKFVQVQMLNSEEDTVIVDAIRNGILQKNYGSPIDWGKLEKTELEKSVWLNRFYYLPSFARLYYLSGDKAYIEDMMNLIRQWIKENPRDAENSNSKYNWYDMQVAWRSIHLSWCYYLCEEGLSDADKTLIVDSLTEHADILFKDFGKQKLNEFNHQAHGALAMLYLGILFPQIQRSSELVEIGMKILEHHIEYAFYEDGGNVEQMFGYYPFETVIFRDAYLLCTNNEKTPPKGSLQLLKKMEHYLSALAQPDGTMPPVNDSYPMPVKATIETLDEILNIKSSEKNNISSFYFVDSQIGVMRSDKSNPESWYLLANPAKLIGSHAHAGRLGFIAWFGKQPIFIESGCNNYDDPLLVKWYRTSRAHNTVLIDGVEDKATSSDKQWAGKRQTENRITDWLQKDNCQMVRMVSPATEETNQSVKWIRSLAFVRNNYLIIYDYFEAENPHDFEILFHLPAVETKVDSDEKTLIMKGEKTFALLPTNKKTYSKVEINKGYVSNHAKNELMPIVSYHTSGKEIHSVLLVAPLNEVSSEVTIKEKVFDDGIFLVVKDALGKSDSIMLRKPNASIFRYKKHEISDWMAVF